MPMNNAQARVVDPVLTEVALGYSDNELVGHELFPEVPVMKRGGKVIKFGKEAFFKHNAARAPGADTQRVMYGYLADAISLIQESLEGQVPIEWMQEAEGVPNIQLATRAINNVMSSLKLNVEAERASLATNAANYAASHKETLSGTDQWNHADADIFEQIRDYKDVVRRSVGRFPNVLLLGPDAWSAAQVNVKMREHFKYTSADSITLEMMARYLQVQKVVVGTAVYADASDPTADFQDVWGDHAVLAYVPQQNRNIDVPSYGYTYQLGNGPEVETPYWDDRAKSWIYPVNYERKPYLTGQSAGVLLSDTKADS